MTWRTQILEYSRLRVGDDGIVKGVKIVGTKSKNGHTYPPQVLRRAKHLYEGAPVFIEHPTGTEKIQGTRQLLDHFGSLKSVRERGDGNATFGLFGDLHIKQSHSLAQRVMEAINADVKLGLSHNAVCDMNEAKTEVVEIVEVNSVDLTTRPATTKNLFEQLPSAGEPDPSEEKLLALVREIGARVQRLERGGAAHRVSALEDIRADEQTPPIGNTHDDFMSVVRGFPLTNR